MSKRDLHGNAPDKCPVALLLIDVINDLEFPGAELLLPNATKMATCIAKLADRARKCRIPVIYVNDNFGRWRSDFSAQVAHCLGDGVRGEWIVKALQPFEEDYFVLKPKHSGFYATSLDILLEYLGADTLILTGLATNICVLFTANDAFVRDFELFAPEDCCAANSVDEHHVALTQMQQILKADTRRSEHIDFSKFL